MTTRILPQNTSIPPSRKKHAGLSLGCWAFGGRQWGGQDDGDSLDAMAAAWDAGMRHWDTALGYGAGHSEGVCGRFLKGKWDEIFIATKGGLSEDPGKVEENLHQSLRNLGTDRVDLYYVHWPKSDIDMRPIFERLERAREKGLFQCLGVSNFSIAQMDHVREVARVDAHQLNYSLYWRKPEKDLIPYCRKHGISVVTYSSIAQGILTGKFPRHPEFKEGDQRPKTVFYQEDVWPWLYAVTEELKTIAREAGKPLHHLAVRWVARQRGITSVIVGARNRGQVEDNAAAMRGDFPVDLDEKLNALSDTVLQKLPDEDNIFKHYP